MVITKEKNLELFKMLADKYQNSIFKNEAGALREVVIKGEQKFAEIDVEKQCKVLINIMQHMCEGFAVDMVLLGSTKSCGIMRMSKMISSAKEMVLITQSPAGIYQAEHNLLEE